MEPILTGENYKVTWYDSEKTIVLAHITKRWNWDEASKVMFKVDEQFVNLDHDGFAVYLFERGTNILPEGKSTLLKMREHLLTDPEKQRLVIIVNSGSVVETVLNMALTAYRLSATKSKYRFVRTMNEALAEIKQYRLTHQTA